MLVIYRSSFIANQYLHKWNCSFLPLDHTRRILTQCSNSVAPARIQCVYLKNHTCCSYCFGVCLCLGRLSIGPFYFGGCLFDLIFSSYNCRGILNVCHNHAGAQTFLSSSKKAKSPIQQQMINIGIIYLFLYL